MNAPETRPMESLECENEELQAMLTQALDELEELRTKYTKLAAASTPNTVLQDDYATRLKRTRIELAEKDYAMASLRLELAEAQKVLNLHKFKYDQTAQLLKDVEANRDLQKSELEALQARSNATGRQLRKELREALFKNEQYAADNLRSKVELQELEAQVRRLAEAHNRDERTLQESVAAKDSEIAALAAKLTEEQKSRQSEVGALQELVKSNEGRAEQLTEQLKDEKAARSSEVDTLQAIISVKDNQLGDMAAKLKETEQSRKLMDRQLADNTAMVSEIKSLQASMAHLSSSHAKEQQHLRQQLEEQHLRNQPERPALQVTDPAAAAGDSELQLAVSNVNSIVAQLGSGAAPPALNAKLPSQPRSTASAAEAPKKRPAAPNCKKQLEGVSDVYTWLDGPSAEISGQQAATQGPTGLPAAAAGALGEVSSAGPAAQLPAKGQQARGVGSAGKDPQAVERPQEDASGPAAEQRAPEAGDGVPGEGKAKAKRERDSGAKKERKEKNVSKAAGPEKRRRATKPAAGPPVPPTARDESQAPRSEGGAAAHPPVDPPACDASAAANTNTLSTGDVVAAERGQGKGQPDKEAKKSPSGGEDHASEAQPRLGSAMNTSFRAGGGQDRARVPLANLGNALPPGPEPAGEQLGKASHAAKSSSTVSAGAAALRGGLKGTACHGSTSTGATQPSRSVSGAGEAGGDHDKKRRKLLDTSASYSSSKYEDTLPMSMLLGGSKFQLPKLKLPTSSGSSGS